MLGSVARRAREAVVLIPPWRSMLPKTKELHKSISVDRFVLITASQAATVGVVMVVEVIKKVLVGLFKVVERNISKCFRVVMENNPRGFVTQCESDRGERHLRM